MARILFLLEPPNRRALSGIVYTLHNAGHKVDIFEGTSANLYVSKTEDIERIAGKTIHEIQRRAPYDFGIVCMHNGNPGIRHFQENVHPRYGYFDIEHDLLTGTVETSPKNQALGTFSFHKRHTQMLDKNGNKYFEAEWYKGDHGPALYPVNPASMGNCIVIDTILADRGKAFEHAGLFKDCFLKGWYNLATDCPFGNSLQCSREWDDTQSLYDLARRAFFGFSTISSAIVELLMIDRIPILWGNVYKNEHRITDFISEVEIINPTGDTAVTPQIVGKHIKGITTENLEDKIRALREDPALLHSVLVDLQADWIFDGPRPHVGDVIASEIARLTA